MFMMVLSPIVGASKNLISTISMIDLDPCHEDVDGQNATMFKYLDPEDVDGRPGSNLAVQEKDLVDWMDDEIPYDNWPLFSRIKRVTAYANELPCRPNLSRRAIKMYPTGTVSDKEDLLTISLGFERLGSYFMVIARLLDLRPAVDYMVSVEIEKCTEHHLRPFSEKDWKTLQAMLEFWSPFQDAHQGFSRTGTVDTAMMHQLLLRW